jgi:hypothetical protein
MSILKSNKGSNLEKLGCMCCLLFLIEKSQFSLAVVIRYLHMSFLYSVRISLACAHNLD